MTILLVGGGTGGHITPILAVAHKLKLSAPNARLVYIGEKNARFGQLIAASPDIDAIHTVYAGKFRRYHGESLLTKLLDVKTNYLNLRDVIYTIMGMAQALWLVKGLQADVMLSKGGFVCVPVGLAAAVWKVPVVTHDSDSIPGLANRIIGRFAARHATGMPVDLYNYPADKMTYTGIPLSKDYVKVTSASQAAARTELQIPLDSLVVFVTGGSLGAQRLNKPVAVQASALLEAYPELWIIHQVGKGNKSAYSDDHDRLVVAEYLDGMHRYSAAADVVIARAGATTIAELALQAKPTILVPSPFLSGGHQVMNAQYLAERGMVRIVEEKELATDLEPVLTTLLGGNEARTQLGETFHEIAKPNAANDIARILVEVSTQ